MLTARLGAYRAVLFIFLEPTRAAAFLAVTGRWLGVSLAASHTGMPVGVRSES